MGDAPQTKSLDYLRAWAQTPARSDAQAPNAASMQRAQQRRRVAPRSRAQTAPMTSRPGVGGATEKNFRLRVLKVRAFNRFV